MRPEGPLAQVERNDVRDDRAQNFATGGFEAEELCEEAKRASVASEAAVSRIETSFALESAKLSKSRDGFRGNGASLRDRARNLLERARKRPFRDDSNDD